MKSEDGTGSRHPCWRCGNVTPPISFISKMVTPVTIFFLTTIDYQNFSGILAYHENLKSPRSQYISSFANFLIQATCRNRTGDLFITSETLYRLSQGGIITAIMRKLYYIIYIICFFVKPLFH